MQIKPINSPHATIPTGGFSQAIEVSDATRTLYITGQVPLAPGRETPTTFKEQAELTWANVNAQLEAAGMTPRNLVKTTIFLTDPRNGAEFREARKALLGDHVPASTLIIAQLANPAWMIEIEGIAVA